MDLQRSLLIGVIAVLSFMLLTEWVAFTGEREAQAVTPQTRLTDSGTGIASASGQADIPVTLDAPAVESSDDLPTLEPETTEAAPQSSSNAGRIVQVYTDVLQLAIDLDGGDIVEVALPKHLAEIDNPDVPFVLLEQNANRVYVAQSGLIGPDGIDSTGRATVSAAQPRKGT